MCGAGGKEMQMATSDEDGQRGSRPATRMPRWSFKLRFSRGGMVEVSAELEAVAIFIQEGRGVEGRVGVGNDCEEDEAGFRSDGLNCYIGRLWLDRPNDWAGAPAQIVALFF